MNAVPRSCIHRVHSSAFSVSWRHAEPHRPGLVGKASPQGPTLLCNYTPMLSGSLLGPPVLSHGPCFPLEGIRKQHGQEP